MIMINELQAYLYLQDGEYPPLVPEFDMDSEDGKREYEEWCIQDNAWFEGSDPIVSHLNENLEYSKRFIERTRELLIDLEIRSNHLNDDESVSSQYMVLFYDAAKDIYDHDKKMIREYFRRLYLVAFGYPDGPRWGEFVEIYGVENFIDLIHDRLENLI